MMIVAPITAFALTVWAVAWVLTRLTLDHPNDRSSHSVPTPRGGGLGVIPSVLFAWAVFSDYRPWPLLAGALALMAASLIDDRRGLPPLVRLIVQAVMVGVFTLTLPESSWPILAVAAFLLLWFVNVYNFMDGIDGIAGVETLGLGLGIAVIAAQSGDTAALAVPALCLAAAGLGFLVWNWHPAKVFLGDCGSVPLGLLTGGLLIMLAFGGQWAAALILPAYYLADATVTIGVRLITGDEFLKPHRKHFYQRASRGDAGPAKVSSTVLVGNIGLILAAWIAANGQTFLGLLLGAAIVAGLLALLHHWGRNAPP